MRRISMRGTAVAVGLGLTLALGAAGPAAIPAAAEVQRGGTLTAIIVAEPATMDPYFGHAPGGADRAFYNLFYDSLVFQDADGAFQPALAESWDYSEDGTAITFQLRQDVMFHDGTPFNAEAVKFNIDRLLDPDVNATARQFVDDLASAEVLGPYEVRMNLNRPSGAFLSVMAMESGHMASPTALQERGEDFHRNPVGTGPFTFAGWTGGRVEGVRNENYWRIGEDGERLPYVDRVVVRVINNTAVKLVELRSGNAQLGDTIQVRDFEQVEREPNLRLIDTRRGPVQYMAFNVTRPPFDNVELRKAVSLAIDRPAMEQVISRGQGIPLKGLKPPVSLAYSDDLVGHELDLDAARAAYEASGHSGPLELVVIQRDPDTQIAQLVQSMLGQAGIEVRISVLERAAWLDRVLGRTYEFGILQASLPRPDPDLSFSTYYGHNARQNFSGIEDNRLHDLVDIARAETDPEVRRSLYVEAQQVILDNYYQTYFLWRPAKEVARNELRDYTHDYSGSWFYQWMWLEQ